MAWRPMRMAMRALPPSRSWARRTDMALGFPRMVVCGLLIAACAKTRAPAPVSAEPPPRAEPRTTDGALAVGNLDSQIAGAERVLALNPRTPSQLGTLAALLLLRGQYRGRLPDY